MKERSLMVFTILSQMAVGAFWVLGALYIWATRQAGVAAVAALTDKAQLAIAPLMVLGMLASFFHLGMPFNAWRVFANLRSSWLSREILFAVLFAGATALFAGLQWFKLGTLLGRNLIASAAALLGLGLLYSMANAYRVRTVPAWNTWVTPASFFATAFLLGGLAVGAALAIDSAAPLELVRPALQWIALGAVVLLGVQLLVIPLWIARLAADQGPGLRAAVRITQEHGAIFRLRLALAVLGVAVAGIALSPLAKGEKTGMATLVAFGLVLASEVLGRLLFYEARVRHGV